MFFRHASVSSTYSGQSVSLSVGDTLEFAFCQRLWDLTKRRDYIVVADMVADMAANMEVHTVADIEVDKVAVKVADMVANMAANNFFLNKWPTWRCT